mgnify:CR=1 FL=1
MPLMNIPYSAQSYYIFDIMIQVMAFDFLPIAEYVDFGFQKSDPWDHNFEWLGYESSNYIECLGSIAVFATLIMI